MVFEIASLLKESGHIPVLLHFDSTYVAQFAGNNDLEQHIVPNHRLYKKTYLLPFFWLRTRRFIKNLKLDCLHSHLFGPIVGFSALAKSIGLPHIGTLHDVYMIEEAPARIWLIKLATVLGTRLVAVSKAMQHFYEQAGRYRRDCITYIPNCTATNPCLPRRQQLRDSLQIDNNTIVVISVGRLVPLKRFHIAVEALRYTNPDCDIKLMIAGGGPELTKLEALAQRHGLLHRVQLLGERNDIQQWLAAADIFTLTSETEGMSRSILEALASQLPVVATDVGGNSDLVIHGDNGFLMEDSRPETLAGYLNRLATDNNLRLTMGRKSLALSEREYSPELFLQRHLALYRQAILDR